jgi:hypothetical protein
MRRDSQTQIIYDIVRWLPQENNCHIGLLSKKKFSRNKLSKIKYFIAGLEWWILDDLMLIVENQSG